MFLKLTGCNDKGIRINVAMIHSYENSARLIDNKAQIDRMLTKFKLIVPSARQIA